MFMTWKSWRWWNRNFQPLKKNCSISLILKQLIYLCKKFHEKYIWCLIFREIAKEERERKERKNVTTEKNKEEISLKNRQSNPQFLFNFTNFMTWNCLLTRVRNSSNCIVQLLGLMFRFQLKSRFSEIDKWKEDRRSINCCRVVD